MLGPANRVFQSPDGTPIACHVTGDGQPLVLVHGTTADHHRWKSVLAPLEAQFTCYAVDRRGRGDSGDTEPYAIEREFEDIAAVIDGIGGPVDVLAHSYGAICALEAATRANNLRRMVLYEPPVQAGIEIYKPGLIERLEAMLAAGDRDGVVATFMREGPKVPPAELDLMRSKPAWPARVAAAHTIPRELRGQAGYMFHPGRFRALHTPTLFLLGGASPPFFKAALDLVQPEVRGSRVTVLPGQQHTAMDTGPDLFLAAVLGFLAAP